MPGSIINEGSPVVPIAGGFMAVAYGDLQAKLAGLYYGRWSITTPLVAGSPLSAAQIAQIDDCIKDGLNAVYSAHHWSFLRSIQSITTTAPYTAATITVASGVVTLVTGSWPAWLATTSTLLISGVTYAITDISPFTISPAPDDIATATACSLLPSPIYALPTGYDAIEGPLTFASGLGYSYERVDIIREVDLRKRMTSYNAPSRPLWAAPVTPTFDPTTAPGSLRQVRFYPVPDAAYVLSAVMTARPLMLDATNKYPLGAEVLAPVLLESVLAAAERNLEDAAGIHNEQFIVMLAAAVKRDREYSTPDSLGPGMDPESPTNWNQFYRQIGGISMPGYDV